LARSLLCLWRLAKRVEVGKKKQNERDDNEIDERQTEEHGARGSEGGFFSLPPPCARSRARSARPTLHHSGVPFLPFLDFLIKSFSSSCPWCASW
jgi:hypothetical protein